MKNRYSGAGKALALAAALLCSPYANGAEKNAFEVDTKIDNVRQVVDFVRREYNISHIIGNEVMYMALTKCRGYYPTLILHDTKPYGEDNKGDKLEIKVYGPTERIPTGKIENGKHIFKVKKPDFKGRVVMDLDGRILLMTGIEPDYFSKFWEDLNQNKCAGMQHDGELEI